MENHGRISLLHVRENAAGRSWVSRFELAASEAAAEPGRNLNGKVGVRESCLEYGLQLLDTDRGRLGNCESFVNMFEDGLKGYVLVLGQGVLKTGKERMEDRVFGCHIWSTRDYNRYGGDAYRNGAGLTGSATRVESKASRFK
jgi:hypothetical protein